MDIVVHISIHGTTNKTKQLAKQAKTLPGNTSELID